MANLLYWLTGFLPLRVISDDGTPYLERYYLFTLLGYVFYVHRFVGSDPDRGLHDHPWRRAFSIVLSGHYLELTRYGYRRVRWFNTITGDTFHRVVLPSRNVPLSFYPNGVEPCYTLFFHTAKKAKPWGFLRDTVFKNNSIYTPYEHSGKSREWWKTAKTRRQITEGL